MASYGAVVPKPGTTNQETGLDSKPDTVMPRKLNPEVGNLGLISSKPSANGIEYEDPQNVI